MKKFIIILSGIFAVLLLSSYACVASDKTEVKNVNFMKDNAEIYVLPQSGSVWAEVVLSSTEARDATFILAAYDENGLESVSCPTKSVEYLLPTVNTGSVEVTENTRKIKLMVWDSLGSASPIATDEYVLSDKSRDTRIASFIIPGRTGSLTEYYKGMINHDQKTIRLYVPTATWKSNTVSPRTSDGGSTFLPVYFNTVTPAMYETIVSSAVPSITLADGCSTVSDLNIAKDFSENQTYTVTAEDGTTATYTVITSETAVQVVTTFDETRLTATQAMASADSSTYVYNSNATAAKSRLGVPNAGNGHRQSGGFWKFLNGENLKVTYDDATGYVSDTSNLDITLETGDRYNEKGKYISFNVKEAVAESAGFTYTADGANNSAVMDEIFVSFDFKIDAIDGERTGGVRYEFPKTHFLMSIGNDVNENEVLVLRARAAAGDSNFTGQTAVGNGYTTVRRLELNPDVWHNVKAISVEQDINNDGNYTLITEYYIDDCYIGYTYKTDYDVSALKLDTYSFKTMFNTKLKLCIDNYIASAKQ